MVNLEVINNPVELEIAGEPPVLLEVVQQTVEIETVAVQGVSGPPGPAGDVGGSLPWANIFNKPSTFPPSAHQHGQVDITDLEPAVDLVLLFENSMA